MTVGDFDSDGHLDLAVANVFSGTVSVLLGNGDGTFQAAQQAATASGLGSLVVGEFNGDGMPDLAVAGGGGVRVLLGNGNGTFQAAQRFPTGNGPSSLAAGDFNGDGFSDLAVGVPFEDLGTASDAGTVEIFYGSPNGLTFVSPDGAPQFLTQDNPESGDMFGFALTWGQFNADVIGDLAVGAPGETYTAIATPRVGAGEVSVAYGSSAGLAQPSSNFTLGSAGGSGDRFGAALTAGNFGGLSAKDDLAIGAPFNDTAAPDAGMVRVIFSDGTGVNPSSFPPQTLTQAGPDTPEAGDAFGSSLVARNFDGAGGADLAIGVPLEDVFVLADDKTYQDAGAVNVAYQTGSGLSTASQFWTQASGSVADHPEPGDRFGNALAANDFNADGLGDLAIGVPLEDLPSGNLIEPDAGAVNVLKGSSVKLTDQGNEFLTQDTPNVADQAEAFDEFGSALSAWDFSNDGHADLAIGVPFEDFGNEIETPTSARDTGGVNVIYELGTTLSSGSQFWQQSDFGTDPPEGGDQFGGALY